jgi:hypothetical protein
MRCRFSKFVVNVCDFCESKYRKVHICFLERINLFQYSVWFVRV